MKAGDATQENVNKLTRVQFKLQIITKQVVRWLEKKIQRRAIVYGPRVVSGDSSPRWRTSGRSNSVEDGRPDRPPPPPTVRSDTHSMPTFNTQKIANIHEYLMRVSQGSYAACVCVCGASTRRGAGGRLYVRCRVVQCHEGVPPYPISLPPHLTPTPPRSTLTRRGSSSLRVTFPVECRAT